MSPDCALVDVDAGSFISIDFETSWAVNAASLLETRTKLGCTLTLIVIVAAIVCFTAVCIAVASCCPTIFIEFSLINKIK